MGLCHGLMGDYPKAAKHHQEALRVALRVEVCSFDDSISRFSPLGSDVVLNFIAGSSLSFRLRFFRCLRKRVNNPVGMTCSELRLSRHRRRLVLKSIQ